MESLTHPHRNTVLFSMILSTLVNICILSSFDPQASLTVMAFTPTKPSFHIHSAPTSTFNEKLSFKTTTTTSTTLFSTAAKAEAPALPDGLVKTVQKQGSGPILRKGDVAMVKYSCYAPNDDDDNVYNNKAPFAKSDRQRMLVGDGSMIPGWDMVLQTMQEGESATVEIVDPNFGYGEEGVPPFIPPNAKIECNIEILDVEYGMGFDDFGELDDSRALEAITAAYEKRQKKRALEEANKKEGVEGMIEKFKSFYFFGFFEGETGQKPPWFLRPSISFPLAFLVVGAAFYVSYVGGGIKERGAQMTDELDEIITTSAAIHNSVILALATFGNDLNL